MMLRDSNRHLEEKIAALREENARLRAELYGKKSERTVASDLDITIEEVPAKEEPKPTAADGTQQNKTDKPAKRTRRLRVHYTREIEETLIPDEVKAAPADYERLPESAERVSLRVEIVPAHLALHIYRCPAFVRVGKRGRKKQEAPIRAAAPATILPGSNIGNSIIALLLHNKYVLKLPLYRQIREFERLGILNLSEGVLCNWVRGGADAMEPIWKSMHNDLFAAPVLHVDETPIRCLKSDKTNGYMWVMSRASDRQTLYYWADTRGSSVLDSMLREDMKHSGTPYNGTIVTDAYTGYDSWVNNLPEEERPNRQLCWAHMRRNFVNCAKNSNDPRWSQEMVNLIRPLYRLEKELRQGAPPPEEIRKRRQEESAVQVKEIFSAMEKRLSDTQNPPINALRRAIDYAMERRELLESWLYDPNIPIDNNTAERAVRPVTIGRKNSLFIGAPEAGQRSAILYTMMEECKRCKVDSLAWLTWVLDRLPNYRGDYRDLYPSAMPQPQETGKERTI